MQLMPKQRSKLGDNRGFCSLDEPFGAQAEPSPGRDGHDGQHDQVESIKELGQLNLPQPTDRIACIPIVGQIEGHMVMPPQNKTTKYEHVIPQLVAVEQNPKIEGVLIVLNTVGGDVEAGLAIAEMIASMSKPTVSLVLGGGHSIGVPVDCI